MNMRIAITGPESTGKSDLAEALGLSIPGSLVVPEAARSYLESKPAGYRYTLDDVLAIAAQQHAMLRAASAHPGIVLCDSDYIVLYIWIREVFGVSDTPVATWMREEQFGLTLLCAPDIPWEADPLRENPHDRDRLFLLYKNELENLHRPYQIVSGLGEQRLQVALSALERFSG
jgi:nicotinamide riboside kinase